MKKIFILISLLFFLNGCFSSMAMIGTGAANGRVVQSSISSALSYHVKQKTGKSPMDHVLGYKENHKPKDKKQKCVKFLESTSSEFCSVIKKKIASTRANINQSFKIEDLKQ
jgi:hypothetical protein|tara:strand:+ start:779 stop:1114 length:336 start_codon:yes stop_codon:yes gene_type:complete